MNKRDPANDARRVLMKGTVQVLSPQIGRSIIGAILGAAALATLLGLWLLT